MGTVGGRRGQLEATSRGQHPCRPPHIAAPTHLELGPSSRVLTLSSRVLTLEFSRTELASSHSSSHASVCGAREREREKEKERERERERETPLCLPCLASTAFARPPLSVFVLFRWLCKTASSVSNTRCLSHAAKHLVFVARSQTRRERLELGLACLVVLVASFELCRAVFVARRELLQLFHCSFLPCLSLPAKHSEIYWCSLRRGTSWCSLGSEGPLCFSLSRLSASSIHAFGCIQVLLISSSVVLLSSSPSSLDVFMNSVDCKASHFTFT